MNDSLHLIEYIFTIAHHFSDRSTVLNQGVTQISDEPFPSSPPEHLVRGPHATQESPEMQLPILINRWQFS